MPVVEVKNLCFAYGGGKTVLRDLSFSVSEGEVFVIAGLSGSGKTTLCHLLCGIIPHAVSGIVSGEIRVMDINPVETGISRTALRIGLVFQDADSQIICTAVEDEIAFGLENLCILSADIRKRVDELLYEFGLYELRNTNPAELSGGEKKLLTIASVLAPSPPVLVLDEPMSGLDSAGRSLVREAIKKQRKQGRAVIIVEHNLKLVTYADKWMLLNNGVAAACDTPSNILQQENVLKTLGLLP